MNCSSVKKNSIIVFVTNSHSKVFNTCFDDASSCPVVLVTKAWTCYCLNYTCTFNSTTLFSRPLRVIIAKLTISLCHHDNSILISLRFRWEMFLKSFFTARFYTDKPMNQRLWLSSLYNSNKKKKKTPMPFSFLNALFRIFQKSMNFSAKIISFFAFRKQS